MITLVLDSRAFKKDFAGILATARNPVAILKTAGRELSTRLKEHFRRKDRTDKNQLSTRRSHFWLAVSRTVSNPFQSGYNSISVSINDPLFAQKVYGGTIRAKIAGALTIPVEEKAYGRSAATFEAETGLKLFLLRTGKGPLETAILAIKTLYGIQVEYVLRKSVYQEPDPTALPEQTALESSIVARAQAALDRQLLNPGGTPA